MKDLKVAVVQATPILFDVAKTIKKVAKLTKEAAASGCSLVLFPESFIPCYPRGVSFGTVIGSRSEDGKNQWFEFWKSSIQVPSKESDQIGKIATDNKVTLVIGVTERDIKSDSLYCTMLYFGSDGKLQGKHRKIKPTGTERLVWGEGNGSDLISVKAPEAKLGGLICWENYMPLARQAMYEQGVEVYLAPTADNRDGWQSTMKHIALEGRCFVLGCNQFVTMKDYPQNFQSEIENFDEVMSKGGSVIIDPNGEVLAGPLWNEEGILTATLEADILIKSKMDFDPVGHYSRPDIFKFKVRKHGKA